MNEQGKPAGVIKSVAALDLTSLRSPEDLAHITEIEAVGVVLVPESLVPALTRIRMKAVASVVPVPDGARVRVHTGALVVGGDALAAPGTEHDVLAVTGALLITSPVREVRYRQIAVTGVVTAPEGSEAALLAGLTHVTGSVRYYRYVEGHRFRVMQGETKLSGEALANPGPDAGDALIVAGRLVVTSPVPGLGWSQVSVLGQMIAPRDSEVVLSAVETVGSVVWYTGTPRVFSGKDRFAPGFFELLDEPTTLVLSGDFAIEPGTSPGLLRRKLASIALSGTLRAPRELLPVLQLLAADKDGEIVELKEPDPGRAPAGTDAT